VVNAIDCFVNHR